MRESVLQRWAVEEAEAQRLGDAIDNLAELERQLLAPAPADFSCPAEERAALARAKTAYEILADAKFLFGDEGINIAGQTRLRPDLVGMSDRMHYVLVELKADPAAERSAVSQLLSYGTSLQVQHPHTNDFVYVIVAGHWTGQLRDSARAMMLGGKMVLPLIWRELPPTAEGKAQFSLSILLELFSFATEQRYQPMEAMSPYTIGIEERGNTPEQGAVSVRAYFGQLAYTLATACSRRLQSGFV